MHKPLWLSNIYYNCQGIGKYPYTCHELHGIAHRLQMSRESIYFLNIYSFHRYSIKQRHLYKLIHQRLTSNTILQWYCVSTFLPRSMSLEISLSTFRALNAHLLNIRCNIGVKPICNEIYCIHSSEKIFPYLQSNMESGSSKIVSD